MVYERPSILRPSHSVLDRKPSPALIVRIIDSFDKLVKALTTEDLEIARKILEKVMGRLIILGN